MIVLNNYEKLWILLCKGQLKEYPWRGSWVGRLKPLFTKIYGWNPDEDNNYNDYLRGMFFKLLEIQLKICDDKSGNNIQLKDIFSASFEKSVSRIDESPIERAIAQLCSTIQNNKVLENGIPRYNLDRQVIVEFAPISERMWYKGIEATINFNQIRMGGNWFDFDDRYIVKEIIN